MRGQGHAEVRGGKVRGRERLVKGARITLATRATHVVKLLPSGLGSPVTTFRPWRWENSAVALLIATRCSTSTPPPDYCRGGTATSVLAGSPPTVCASNLAECALAQGCPIAWDPVKYSWEPQPPVGCTALGSAQDCHPVGSGGAVCSCIYCCPKELAHD